VPIYPVYALLFVDSGMSDGQISTLLAIWSAVGIAAEVPMGAVADRWSHRNALVAGALLQALGYIAWILAPGFAGFAIGFAVWALGGALVSGSSEALLYEGLTAAGAADHYARVQGWATAAEFLAFIPAVLVATALLPIGGYAAIGWVSVATCVAAAMLARRLPSAPATADLDEEEGSGTLRAGLREAMQPTVAGAVIALAVIGGFDAIEEYFPLLAQDWGVPTTWVPIAVLVVTLAGALGAALGGRCASFSGIRVALLTGAAAAALAVAGVAAAVGGLVALAAFYLLHHLVLVVLDARLQARIEGRARATTTSVAGLGTEIVGLGLFGVWALGHLVLVTVLWFAVAAALPVMLRRSRRSAMIGTKRRSDERSDEAGLVRGRR
jgi:predicted MFS family arabinose efflux permease